MNSPLLPSTPTPPKFQTRVFHYVRPSGAETQIRATTMGTSLYLDFLANKWEVRIPEEVMVMVNMTSENGNADDDEEYVILPKPRDDRVYAFNFTQGFKVCHKHQVLIYGKRGATTARDIETRFAIPVQMDD